MDRTRLARARRAYRTGLRLVITPDFQHQSKPEPSMIYSSVDTISQKKLENPAGFWNNVGENTSSLF